MQNENKKLFIKTAEDETVEIDIGSFKFERLDITLKSGMTIFRRGDDDAFDFLGKGIYEGKTAYWTLREGKQKATYFSESGLAKENLFFRFYQKEIKNLPCVVNPEEIKKQLEDHKRKVDELEKTLSFVEPKQMDGIEPAQEKPKTKKQKKN